MVVHVQSSEFLLSAIGADGYCRRFMRLSSVRCESNSFTISDTTLKFGGVMHYTKKQIAIWMAMLSQLLCVS